MRFGDRQRLGQAPGHCGAETGYNECAAKALELDCRSLGLGRAYLQSDSEHAIKKLAAAVDEKLPTFVPRGSPDNSKDSRGRVQRVHRSLEADARALKVAVEQAYDTTVTSDHPLFDSCLRHANFVRERFHRSRADAKTTFCRHQLRDYGSQRVPFGETVMWRDPKGVIYKYHSAWGYGVWLGRCAETDVPIVGTRQGLHGNAEGRSAALTRDERGTRCHTHWPQQGSSFHEGLVEADGDVIMGMGQLLNSDGDASMTSGRFSFHEGLVEADGDVIMGMGQLLNGDGDVIMHWATRGGGPLGRGGADAGASGRSSLTSGRTSVESGPGYSEGRTSLPEADPRASVVSERGPRSSIVSEAEYQRASLFDADFEPRSSVVPDADEPVPSLQQQQGRAAAYGGAIGGGIAFVFALGDVAWNPRGRTQGQKFEDVTGSTAVGVGAGALGGFANARYVAPLMCAETGALTGSAAGAMVGVGAVVGVATVAVMSVWDVAKRARGRITGVEQRRSFASNATGGVGGLLLGSFATLGTMALLGPGFVVLPVLAGFGGGVAGGVGGSALGGVIDSSIWDADEDKAAIAYEFFGFVQKRGKRVEIGPERLSAAYSARCDQNPKDEEWQKICACRVFDVMVYMSDEFRALLHEGERLRAMQGDAAFRGLCAKLSSADLAALLDA
eukprot:NODE_556_length_2932_cov_9.154011.p1 GENE.NODE_556_length_2932_cov_9.154011~~NODE_556_length_2932_cov_9.154011.p1  ORF type:complete len:673 (+),score=40.22 NODE_556_length_2932_cov_9.154011:428-2446(+)